MPPDGQRALKRGVFTPAERKLARARMEAIREVGLVGGISEGIKFAHLAHAFDVGHPYRNAPCRSNL